LIALYDIPEGTRFPLISTLFSRDVNRRIEDDSGWIFGQGGPVYIAYRPFAPGEWKPVDWTGLLKGGAGAWFSTGFKELSEGSECLVSYSLKNGYIVEIAPVNAYETYREFQGAVRELPIEVRLEPTPKVSYTNLAGVKLEAEYGESPSVDGEKVDYSSWKLFDGPFAQAERESQSLEMIYGSERYVLDFKNRSAETSVVETK